MSALKKAIRNFVIKFSRPKNTFGEMSSLTPAVIKNVFMGNEFLKKVVNKLYLLISEVIFLVKSSGCCCGIGFRSSRIAQLACKL